VGGFLHWPDGLTSPAENILSATYGGCTNPTINCYSNSDFCVNTGFSVGPKSYYYDYRAIPWIGASYNDGTVSCVERYWYDAPNCGGNQTDNDYWGVPC
jgi:hypothetical protein